MKILIIEDDISIRNILRMSLQAENHIIDEAEDGEKGSFFARVNKYDLIILDNILPKKFGKQVCEEIRQAGVNTPVLLLSGKTDVNFKIDLLNSGADDYMTKPFSFEELKARIKALTRRPDKLRSEKISIGNIVINLNTCEVIKNNKRIYLTKKEFSLLELLMKNSGNIVSRGTIMDYVWDANADPFSNTIETHIRNVRRKIGDNKKEIIVNIPSRGYRFNVQTELNKNGKNINQQK